MRALLNPPKPQFTKEIALDLETDGFSDRVLMACAVGEDGTRIAVRTLDELVFELRCNGLFRTNVRHWAHNGGAFDWLIILPWALKRGWTISRASVSASGSVWSIDLTKEWDTWCLRDSLRIFPSSLKKIGEALGLAKLDVDRSNIAGLSESDAREYCLRDCDILLTALLKFRTLLRGYRGELLDTLAGSASRIVRQRIPADNWGWSQDSDTVGASAYYGGRVERFRNLASQGRVVDINSAYPWALTLRLPTRHVGSGTGKPPADMLCVVRARVKVRKDTFVGPLPYRPVQGALKDRLVFPTGEWEGSYTLEELEAACEDGSTTYEPIVWHAWDSEPWLYNLVSEWYAIRKREGGYLNFAVKILLNSLYGKFIERAEGETFTTDSKVARKAEARGLKVSEQVLYGSPLWGIYDVHEGTARHAALAAHVTARARIKLLRAMRSASRLDYCDTDSVMGVVDIPGNDSLGEFKHECDYESAEFLASKLYRLNHADRKPTVKAKGYARGDGAVELWDTIKQGLPVTNEATRLFKSSVKTGTLEFARVERVRRRLGGLDKRCFVGNDSRPWDVAELAQLR